MNSLRNHLVFFLIAVIFLTGCKKEKEPSVQTESVSDISGNSAISGGTVTDEGSSKTIARGVVWSTNDNPTLADNKTNDGSGVGSYTSNLTDLNGDAVYFVRAYATNSAGTSYGEAVSFTSFGEAPIAATSSASDISSTKATLNAIVDANFMSTLVTFEYGTTTNYGISLTYSLNPLKGGSNVNISAIATGLSEATVYHYRVKAENDLGIIYGNDKTFTTMLTDVDGNRYNTVIIGDQMWMKENLKTSRYKNGDLIATSFPANADITIEASPKYQWPCNIAENGRFYTYYTITDSRKICPTGWHIPTDEEMTDLSDYLTNNKYGFGGSGDLIAKSLANTSGWAADATPGNVGNDQASNNSSGFTGMAGGGRYANGATNFVSYHGIWWSSTESNSSSAYFRCIGYLPGTIFRGVFNKSYGLTVRCLKD